MRCVLDTNVVVSALLWRGEPRVLVEAAIARQVTLITSRALLAELREVLERAKFASRLSAAGVIAAELVVAYGSLAEVVDPKAIPATVLDDPDDDAVLACAVSGGADAIVSGDRHLRALGRFRQIPVLSVAEALERLGQ